MMRVAPHLHHTTEARDGSTAWSLCVAKGLSGHGGDSGNASARDAQVDLASCHDRATAWAIPVPSMQRVAVRVGWLTALLATMEVWLVALLPAQEHADVLLDQQRDGVGWSMATLRVWSG